jgi:hypothetical protein
MKLYYLIWTDFLVGRAKNRPDMDNWKFQVFVIMTWLNSMNLWTLFAFLKSLGIGTFLLQLSFMEGTRVNSAIAFFIQFALVFCLINYFLIFYKDRYKKIIKEYPYSGGRVIRNYILITAGSSLLMALSLFIFYNNS